MSLHGIVLSIGSPGLGKVPAPGLIGEQEESMSPVRVDRTPDNSKASNGPLAATFPTSSFLSTSLYALAMTERTRAVIIDDRDRRIQFTGNWIAASGEAYNNRGRHGPVYRNTLQGSTTNGAKLTFSFSGEFSLVAVSLIRSLADFHHSCRDQG
jgi:hypothetical protein